MGISIDTPHPYVKPPPTRGASDGHVSATSPRASLSPVERQHPLNARERLAAWRRTRPRTPPLTRHRIGARGLEFAVRMSPPVPGTVPVLAINGGMIYGHDLLWPTFAPLAEGRQVILYDQRGRGESQAPPGSRAARIEHDALDVRALREALGIPQWDLAAHSWGGGIALLAAAEDPDGVRRIVTFNAVGPTSGWLNDLHGRGVAHLAARGLDDERAALAALDPRALFVEDPELHARYSRALYPAWFHDVSAMLAPPPLSLSPTGAAVAARLRREGYDWRASHARVQAPVLLIHGEEDALPVTEADANAHALPRAHVLRVAEAGHMPFFEWPALVFDAAVRFLDA